MPGSPPPASNTPLPRVLAAVPVLQGPLVEVCVPSSQKTVPLIENAPVINVVAESQVKDGPLPILRQAVLVTAGGGLTALGDVAEKETVPVTVPLPCVFC